ncbi:MAG: pilus assembly protein Flp/PilA [Pirellulaceae bacterium]|jgi:pilus assembly protein Flp/PilA
MCNSLLRFLKQEDGPTAVEYAVLLALIVLIAIGGIRLFGNSTSGSLTGSSESISDYMSKSGVDVAE